MSRRASRRDKRKTDEKFTQGVDHRRSTTRCLIRARRFDSAGSDVFFAMPIVHRFTGAIVRRTIDPSRATVAEHAHDWPMLSLYVMGSYRNVTERGEHDIAGPSFVFYGRGAAHSNAVGEAGFEQIEVEFDPDWLASPALPREAVLLRIGGGAGAHARQLAGACGAALDEEYLRQAMRRLLSAAEDRAAPAWIAKVDAALRADP